METIKANSEKEREITRFIKEDFQAHFGESPNSSEPDPRWSRLRELGTELWLDTGDCDEIGELWNSDFSALTTNNTLLNREIQKGTYDDLIPRAAEMLNSIGVRETEQLQLELAFILNARHALSLVEKFDAHVSVEEHTNLADSVEPSVEYARRYYRICPERFYVKIPLTPAGILATRKLSQERIPVNQTLGFSARQNYLAARIATPKFVNVFLGRLNSFVEQNELGDGTFVGERATLASQNTVLKLREKYGLETRQIAASMRDGKQIRDLAGVDVFTMPLKAAKPFLEMKLEPDELDNSTDKNYQPSVNDDVEWREIRLGTLWDLPDVFIEAVEDLASRDLDGYTPRDLVDFMAERGFADLFPCWTEDQIRASRREGKIPMLSQWGQMLRRNETGLDALMNLAAINSFAADQTSMDQRVFSLLE